jgi:hypothetical protein
MSKKGRKLYTIRRQKQKRACGSKRRYDSPEEASVGMLAMLTYLDRKDPMEVYKCPYGNHYHFGHAKALVA